MHSGFLNVLLVYKSKARGPAVIVNAGCVGEQLHAIFVNLEAIKPRMTASITTIPEN
jgi:hypothetical protein